MFPAVPGGELTLWGQQVDPEKLGGGMRIFLVLAASPLLATFAPLALYSQPAPPAKTWLDFTSIALDERDPARRSVGALTFLGGWVIRSNDRRFGGISALHVEGKEVTALSDAGSVIRFALPESGRAEANIMRLPDGPSPSGKKGTRDSESMAVRRNRLWIAFEGENEVWRYSRTGLKAEASAKPPAMKGWPANGGSEAMLRLPDGRFLILAETKELGGGATEALLFDGDPALAGTKTRRIAYRAPKGYLITDAALLPDGRLLFLNRRFALTEGVSAKLTLAPKPDWNKVEALSGTGIVHLQPPLTVDNMEALSVTQEGGRTILWMASDDNFNPLQRTLLLKFALSDE